MHFPMLSRHSVKRPAAGLQLRPTSAAPCWDRPQRPAQWLEYLSPQPSTLGRGQAAPRGPACHERSYHGAPGNSPGTRYSGIVSKVHRWDGRWHADYPTPTSRDTYSPYGDKSAARCPPCGAAGGWGAWACSQKTRSQLSSSGYPPERCPFLLLLYGCWSGLATGNPSAAAAVKRAVSAATNTSSANCGGAIASRTARAHATWSAS